MKVTPLTMKGGPISFEPLKLMFFVPNGDLGDLQSKSKTPHIILTRETFVEESRYVVR